MKRISNFFKSSLLLVLSFTVAFIIGELVLRSLGHRGVTEQAIKNIEVINDPVVNWRYMPGSVKFEEGVEHNYNNIGFRDIEHKLKKLSGDKRIVVVGDSITDGYGVKFNNIFSRVLQTKLNTAFEVINIAQGGMNFAQDVYLLKKYGVQYSPDIVVINFVLNDFDSGSLVTADDSYNKEKENKIGLLGGMSIDPRFKSFLKQSAFIYFVKRHIENIKGVYTGEEILTQDYFSRIWSNKNNRLQISTAFKELSKLSKQQNFDTYVLIWPVLIEYSTYRYADMHKWVIDEAEKNNIKSIDLIKAYSKYSFRDLQVTSADNIHPNKKGHELSVDTFIERLKNQ